MKYDHAFTLAFNITSETEDASDVTAHDVRVALIRWVEESSDDDLLTNIGVPFDTYEVEI